jgi:hypothetical protein
VSRLSEDLEAASRLRSVLDVLEHELRALGRIDDERLDAIVQAGGVFRAEIVPALAALTPPQPDGV